MIREAENIVKIEGILSETDLKYGSFEKNGETKKSIGGVIKIQVNQVVNDKPVTLEVPVHMFAPETTNNGGKNPAYQSIERIMNEYTSIAAAGGVVGADGIRITNGKISMNEYYSPDGRLISFPRITASFVNKVRQDELEPKAEFSTQFVVAKKEYETDVDGVETGRFKITGIIPGYNGKVEVVNFISDNPKVITPMDRSWNENDTVAAIGRLNFTSRTETVIKEVDFGEPQKTTRTISVSELVITGGAASPLDGELAYEMEDIQAGLAERKDRLEASKKKAANKTNKKTPVKAPITDLGF